jgi:hypothetical protein
LPSLRVSSLSLVVLFIGHPNRPSEFISVNKQSYRYFIDLRTRSAGTCQINERCRPLWQ